MYNQVNKLKGGFTINTSHNKITRITQNTVYSHIQSFLRNKGVKSKNTQEAYHDDLQQFFSYIRNKSLEDLLPEDLNLTNSDMLDYQTYLKEEYLTAKNEHYSNNTVNRKIAPIISLFTHLKKNEYPVDPDKLRIDDLDDDSVPYGFLAPNEIDQMIDLVQYHRNGNEKKALIMLAVRTSLRKEALLNLTWNKIMKSPDKDNAYIIKTKDKNDPKSMKEIHVKMYNILLSIKNDSSPKIFHMSPRTVDEMMSKLCLQMGIDPRRKISFHSLKKEGVNFVHELTGDIHATQSQAGHSSPNTTSKFYIKPQMNIAGMAMDEDIDTDIFKKLTHEQLLRLVESMGNGVGLQLRREAAKILS